MSKVFTILKGESLHKGARLNLTIHELISGEIIILEGETGSTGLSLGNLIYILDYAPTRNMDTFEMASIAPDQVHHDEDTDLYFFEADLPDLNGTEWIRVCPPDSEDDCYSEYIRCKPLRREVQPGKVIVQMLNKPEKEFHVGLKIHDYVSFDDIQAEKTDMTKEELKALLGGILPTRNEEFVEKHTINPEDNKEGVICLDVEGLLSTDVPDLDTADKLSKEEHRAWGKAGLTYDHHEDGKLYIKFQGKIPEIPLNCLTRIARSTEIGE